VLKESGHLFPGKDQGQTLFLLEPGDVKTLPGLLKGLGVEIPDGTVGLFDLGLG